MSWGLDVLWLMLSHYVLGICTVVKQELLTEYYEEDIK